MKIWICALVVVGNQKGSIGIGKVNQNKCLTYKKHRSCKKKFNKNPIKEGRTLAYDKRKMDQVRSFKGSAGTGIIAGGAIRSVCEVIGIQRSG